jgi:hypothetical protein
VYEWRRGRGRVRLSTVGVLMPEGAERHTEYIGTVPSRRSQLSGAVAAFLESAEERRWTVTGSGRGAVLSYYPGGKRRNLPR